FVGGLDRPRERVRFRGEFRLGLELDVDVGFGALVFADGAVWPRPAVIEQHHVVLNHAEPFGFGIFARAHRVLLALQGATLLDIGARALMAGLFVVPKREADRALRYHVRAVEDARELHHERGARAVVIGGFVPAVAVHVGGDDVHLFGMRGAYL